MTVQWVEGCSSTNTTTTTTTSTTTSSSSSSSSGGGGGISVIALAAAARSRAAACNNNCYYSIKHSSPRQRALLFASDADAAAASPCRLKDVSCLPFDVRMTIRDYGTREGGAA